MIVVYLLLWIIFNERLTTEVFLIGLAASALIDLFVRKILGKAPRKRFVTWLRLAGAGTKYVFGLLWEVLKCNWAVIRLIVSPKLEVEPELHYFQTKLKTDAARVTLANSITLTPGTITCTLEDDRLCVHALDSLTGEGVESSGFEEALLKMEEIADER